MNDDDAYFEFTDEVLRLVVALLRTCDARRLSPAGRQRVLAQVRALSPDRPLPTPPDAKVLNFPGVRRI